MTAAHL